MTETAKPCEHRMQYANARGKWCRTCKEVLEVDPQPDSSTEPKKTVEPCRHDPMLVVGDEWGHPICQVCRAIAAEFELVELRQQVQRLTKERDEIGLALQIDRRFRNQAESELAALTKERDERQTDCTQLHSRDTLIIVSLQRELAALREALQKIRLAGPNATEMYGLACAALHSYHPSKMCPVCPTGMTNGCTFEPPTTQTNEEKAK